MGWLEGLILASMALGLGLLAMRQRPWAARAERGSAMALGLLSLSLLWPFLQGSTGWCVTLFPGAECAGLVARPPGVYLAVIALVALGLAQLLPREQETHWPGLGHLLCGLVAAGVTVDHMLMRFLLVEMAALPTLFMLLADGNRGLPLWRNILLLRVAGDVFLLLILGLYALAGTWAIDAMLALAMENPAARLWPVLACGLGAVWVKLGLPPADGWLRDALRGQPGRYLLTAGVGLPVLGGYLLYRLRPVLAAANGLALLLGLGALALAWAALQRSRSPGERLLAATGALLVGLAGTSLPSWYLPLLALLRAGIRAAPALLAGRPGCPLARPAPPDERPIREAAQGTLRPAHRLMASVELGLLERLGQRTVAGAHALARALQRQHTGLLGRNLVWACLGIVCLILFGLAFASMG